MKVNFTLWGTGISGGVRVIFELANRMQQRGHDVSITALCGNHGWFPVKARMIYPKPNRMIYFDHISNVLGIRGLKLSFMRKIADITPDCDVNIATYSLTAYSVLGSEKGKAFYYIQHFEPMTLFSDPFMKSLVDDTYYLPLKQIAVSKWLVSKMRPYGKRPTHIPNGIDNEIFHPRHEIEKIPNSVMGIFNGVGWKGENEIMVALKNAAKKKKITLLAAGNMKKFNELVKRHAPINFEIRKFHRPDDRKLSELYSSAEAFLFASYFEGFGLPSLEAMACGTPSVMTDSLGVRDYASNKKNCIMIKSRDVEAFSEAIINILDDDVLRNRLSRNGLKTSKIFTWEKAVEKLEKTLKK